MRKVSTVTLAQVPVSFGTVTWRGPAPSRADTVKAHGHDRPGGRGGHSRDSPPAGDGGPAATRRAPSPNLPGTPGPSETLGHFYIAFFLAISHLQVGYIAPPEMLYPSHNCAERGGAHW